MVNAGVLRIFWSLKAETHQADNWWSGTLKTVKEVCNPFLFGVFRTVVVFGPIGNILCDKR